MKLFLVAGEASGDLHAGNLASALLRAAPDTKLAGFGGAHMRRSGVDVRFDLTSLAVVGFSEVIGNVGRLVRAMRDVRREIASERPDAVVLVDYPGFNLRLARHVHELGIPVIYYIAPQVWAWHRSRVKKIARNVDLLVVVFDFEVEFFAQHGIEARFVGHPLLDTVECPKERGDERRFCVGLLPGSRRSEVERLLPIMLDAGRILRSQVEGIEILVSSASSIEEEVVSRVVERSALEVEIVRGTARDVLCRADAVMVASGTATLETCVFGVPMVVLYKVSFPSYLAAKCMIRIPHASLVNLIAGRAVVPEFMQTDAVPDKVAQGVKGLLEGPRREEMMRDFREVKAKLGDPGASARAAKEILTFLDEATT